MTSSKWVETDFSKKEVMRAGETLNGLSATGEQKLHALDVLSNWRASHAYPMHALLIFLRSKASLVSKSAVVVQ